MIDTDKYYETRDIHPYHLTEFRNAMNEGRIERRHCLWALTEVRQLREKLRRIGDLSYKEVESAEEGNEVLLEIDEVISG
tara:strand:- start:30359 stop:30598 length:240 start_codon:yes stop_codon:yes gene_type:complete